MNAIRRAAVRLVSTEGLKPEAANAKPPFKPKAINRYSDKNLAIGWGTSKSERNKPAAIPKTKNRIAGSRRFCIVIFLLVAMIKTFIHIVKSIFKTFHIVLIL